MNKLIAIMLVLAIGFVFGATNTIPTAYKVDKASTMQFDKIVLKTTLASRLDSAFSNPIYIGEIGLPSLDSLGQVSHLDLSVGTFTVACYDVNDTNTTSTIDSVNTAIFVRAVDIAGDGTDPSSRGSGAWYAVDSAKVLGNGDVGAVVTRAKAVKLASEAPRFIRVVLKGLSGNSYSVPSCVVGWNSKRKN